ncbi:copper chaperone for superoxide dismutase isoform X2 [Leptopilina heterotoma]|uniref:copper chaperone for superoxide dismutase isoform X2 n=1 Tax=Leptopilina heterotoma TaxID=63436 RepID=UPI001CA87343|nr:copper chaperone for superoxide dismutase isoform X2 [Leptopilina heterotoma]
MSSILIEFAVQMTCQNCVNKVKSTLTNVEGIKNVDISLERGTVVVETDLPYSLIQEKIESTGKKAVFKGYGGSESFSAVTMLAGNSGYSYGEIAKGVIRFAQIDKGCIIDGTIDGLSPGAHGLHIHECGDISQGCDSVGDHFNPHNSLHGGPDDESSKRHVGDLGNIVADDSGRVRFRILDNLLKIPEIIGRSLVITEKPDDLGKGDSPMSKIDGNSGKKLVCGIIARSSGLFQNTKQICACDGLTLWDERNRSIDNQKTNSKILDTMEN